MKGMFSFTLVPGVHFSWTAGVSRWKHLHKLWVWVSLTFGPCLPYPCYNILLLAFGQTAFETSQWWWVNK